LPTIKVPKVKVSVNGKKKQRTQMWEMFLDDGRILKVELPVTTGMCDDPKRGKAFLIDAQNQYVDENGDWNQVGWERSLMPVCAIERTKILGTKNKPGDEDDEDLQTQLVGQLYHENAMARKKYLWRNLSKNLVLEKIIWIITIPSVLFFLGFLIIMWRRG
jgi:hypothetical protein